MGHAGMDLPRTAAVLPQAPRQTVAFAARRRVRVCVRLGKAARKMIVVCVALMVVGAVRGQTCSDFPSRLDKCSIDSGIKQEYDKDPQLRVAVESTQGAFGNFAKQQIQTMCRHKPALIAFMECTNNVYKECGQESLAPAEGSARGGYNYLCDNVDNIDFPCLSNSMLTECMQKAFGMSTSPKDQDDMVQTMCRSFAAAKTCLPKTLSCTGGQNIIEQFLEFQKPRACGGSDNISSTLATLILCLFLTLYKIV